MIWGPLRPPKPGGEKTPVLCLPAETALFSPAWQGGSRASQGNAQGGQEHNCAVLPNCPPWNGRTPVTGVTGQNHSKNAPRGYSALRLKGTPPPPINRSKFIIFHEPCGSFPSGVAPRGLSRLTERACSRQPCAFSCSPPSCFPRARLPLAFLLQLAAHVDGERVRFS